MNGILKYVAVLLIWCFAQPITVFSQPNVCNPDEELGMDVEALLLRSEACLQSRNLNQFDSLQASLDQSLEDATRAVELAPDDARTYASRAYAYFALGHYGRAIVDYTIALQVNPEMAEAYGQRALAMRSINDVEGTLYDLSQAIALEPENASWYLIRSQLFNELGDSEAALADLETIIGFDPTYSPAYENIGNIYYDQELYEEALESYQHYLDTTDSPSPVVTTRIQQIQTELGDN